MDNSEILRQILGELQTVKGEMRTMNADIKELKQGQAKLEKGQAKLEEGQAKLEESLSSVRESVAYIENVHGKQIGVLFDLGSATYDIVKDVRKSARKIGKRLDRNDAEIFALKLELGRKPAKVS